MQKEDGDGSQWCKRTYSNKRLLYDRVCSFSINVYSVVSLDVLRRQEWPEGVDAEAGKDCTHPSCQMQSVCCDAGQLRHR